MDNPVFAELALPTLAWQTAFRHLGWSLALAVVLALCLPRRWVHRWWWGVGLGAISNLPGLSEVTSALALSFQTPSLMAQALLASVLWRGLRPQNTPGHAPEGTPGLAPPGAWAITALLGWVLLLDTLGWGGHFIYAWGFGPNVPVGVLLVCAAGLGWTARQAQAHKYTVWLSCLALAMGLFVLTRAPSGNAWDAISDPWLWLVAQGMCAVPVWRGARSRFIRRRSL